jgi:alcohol dehydrogenase
MTNWPQMTDHLSSFTVPTRIVCDPGARRRVAGELAALGAGRVLIVADAALAQVGVLDDVVGALQSARVPFTLFAEIVGEPGTGVVQQALALVREQRCDALVALGGGSAIDAAKATALLATNGGSLSDYDGLEKSCLPPLPVVALPTTAGSGAEVTTGAVITDEARQAKMAIRCGGHRPRVAILDPELLASLPAVVAAASGLDALGHAIEAYVSTLANPFSDALARRAIELIGAHLRPFVARRDDGEAASGMLTASTMAGMAFSNSALGSAHALARHLAPKLGIGHGRAVAEVIAPVIEFNVPAAVEKLSWVAEALGEDVRGLPSGRAAEKAAPAVRRLCQDVGLGQGLAELGLRREDVAEMARLAAAEGGANRGNPRPTSCADFVSLLEGAM